jgi:hypothetical protein
MSEDEGESLPRPKGLLHPLDGRSDSGILFLLMLAVVGGDCISSSGTLVKSISHPKEQQSRSFDLARKLRCSTWTTSQCSASGWHIEGDGFSQKLGAIHLTRQTGQRLAHKTLLVAGEGACGPLLDSYLRLAALC